MLFVTLPKLVDDIFDFDGNRIGFGIFLDQIEEHANNQLYVINFNNQLAKEFQKKIGQYITKPHEHHECCGCELSEQGKIEYNLLKSILDSTSHNFSNVEGKKQ